MRLIDNTVSSVAKDEGESFWQPNGKSSYIEIKASQWYLSDAQQLVFMQELLPGGSVGRHQHVEQEEIFIGLSGHGQISLDEQILDVYPETIVQILPSVSHALYARGEQPWRFMVIVNACGLENRLREMGKVRLAGDAAPDAFALENLVDSHGVRSSQDK